VANQPQAIFSAEPDFCAEGCVLVTYSTGEIVMRYVINPINAGLIGPYANNLNIDAVIEMAGAGGGTILESLCLKVLTASHNLPLMQLTNEFMAI
jgi:hypothetical protein